MRLNLFKDNALELMHERRYVQSRILEAQEEILRSSNPDHIKGKDIIALDETWDLIKEVKKEILKAAKKGDGYITITRMFYSKGCFEILTRWIEMQDFDSSAKEYSITISWEPTEP